jgi:hypothetical protein
MHARDQLIYDIIAQENERIAWKGLKWERLAVLTWTPARIGYENEHPEARKLAAPSSQTMDEQLQPGASPTPPAAAQQLWPASYGTVVYVPQSSTTTAGRPDADSAEGQPAEGSTDTDFVTVALPGERKLCRQCATSNEVHATFCLSCGQRC